MKTNSYVQRKTSQNPDSVTIPVQMRPFASQNEADTTLSSNSKASVQAQLEGAKRFGHNFANVSVLPPDSNSTAVIQRNNAPDNEKKLGTKLPHSDKISESFGKHDISHVQAYTSAAAASVSQAITAEAKAIGSKIKTAFADSAPDLSTAAHEAAHIIQQQAGVQL